MFKITLSAHYIYSLFDTSILRFYSKMGANTVCIDVVNVAERLIQSDIIKK
ncbi:hypothetical protein CBL_05359 [Carabus blaptoides fortunei]